MQNNTSGQAVGQAEMEQCIQNCLHCHTVCQETATQCQQSGGAHAQVGYIRMLQDCAEICRTTAHFMQHDSPLYGYICQACAKVSNHCAGECERMGDTDCANACRNCAWSCDQMGKIAA
ncbi:MAG TPA: four-helix bundle copper-binding protein [Ktedonobacteraceae bacterium]|nr:four-helix bundle copper-binding protein [Ktedonobacteraceae bacterium]